MFDKNIFFSNFKKQVNLSDLLTLTLKCETYRSRDCRPSIRSSKGKMCCKSWHKHEPSIRTRAGHAPLRSKFPEKGIFVSNTTTLYNFLLTQPWWLGGRASALHSVESRSLLPRWVRIPLGAWLRRRYLQYNNSLQ